ncbi:MAG: c-type cytochrome [Roseovarius sp.]
MKFQLAAALMTFAVPALAQDAPGGDPARGETAFRQCASCHAISDPSGGVLVRGGRTGPDLYGIANRPVGAVEGFAYSGLMMAAADKGLAWDEAAFTGYVQDPTGWLRDYTGTDARGKMTFRLRKAQDAVDIWAYLVSLGGGSGD